MEQMPNKIEYVCDAKSAKWPGNLVSAEEVAKVTGITVKRLLSFAEGRYVPHYRIDYDNNCQPQFRIAEVKRWAAEHLLEACPGEALPSPVIVNIKPERNTNHMIVPEAIRQIDGLCDISTETRRIGIYFLVLDMEVIYVGKSVNVAARVTTHGGVPKKNFNKVFYLPWPKDDLDRIETTLIRALQPRENGDYTKKGEIDNKLLETIGLYRSTFQPV